MTSTPSLARIEPIGVDIAESAQAATIHWSDGHESRYPFWYMRGYCPCAVCQGHDGGWDFVDSVDCLLDDVCEVGHYALNFVWRDGHRTGIYSFELLRKLCPCAVCRKAQGAQHAFDRLPPARQRT